MKQEQQLLYKVMRNFEGMQKIEVFDLLHRMEVLLYYAKSPLQSDHLKRIISSDMDQESAVDPFGFTILPNGNFCEFEGSNDWIHIYKEVRRGFSWWNPITTYYFKTKYAPLELLRLNKSNLLENVQNTPHEIEISAFLMAHNISKRDSQGNLLLLGL
ncbi:hypothetical protein D1818_10950 [Aquimarina sp. BL5]|uniref:hypothetical protein n=1 Tax=Aquimarina sp. BL5 TaxID=1714860 RepID=UPI000E4FAD48|nr:hypothetical protein [Aquimarina sp. BL5]AXT51323.1 hypothetical protein D1818_10950 [Aquimarina sp. BL5]RKN09887.1 hypothetical protein D7036_03700 [Aquimarina sp. BL5]